MKDKPPIDNIGETDRQYEEGLPEHKDEWENNEETLVANLTVFVYSPRIVNKEKLITHILKSINEFEEQSSTVITHQPFSSPPDPASKEQENDAAGTIQKLYSMIDYWKKRCEAAENLSRLYGDWQDLLNPDSDEMSKDALEAFQKWEAALKIWQELKNQTP